MSTTTTSEYVLTPGAALDRVSVKQEDWAKLPPKAKAALIQKCAKNLMKYRQEYIDSAMAKRSYDKLGDKSVVEAERVFATQISTTHLASWLRQLQRAFSSATLDSADGRYAFRAPAQPQKSLEHPGVAVVKYGQLDPITSVMTGFANLELHLDCTKQVTPEASPETGLSVVLGAGNYDAPVDMLTALLIDNHVVVYKFSPLSEALIPVLAKVFQPFLDEGCLAFTRGGAAEGGMLLADARVTKWYMTGDIRTAEKILFPEGMAKKAPAGPVSTASTQEVSTQDESQEATGATTTTTSTVEADAIPGLNVAVASKQCTVELGNCTPVLICPGTQAWSDGEIKRVAKHLCMGFLHNGGHVCGHPQLLVTCKRWAQRQRLLDCIKDTLDKAVCGGNSFYPGAEGRIDNLKKALQAEGVDLEKAEHKNGKVVFATDLKPDTLITREECFCAVAGEVALDTAPTMEAFLAEAVPFVNHKVTGNLCITIMAKPLANSRQGGTPGEQETLRKAVLELNYGSVAVNMLAIMCIIFPALAWGGHPKNASYTNLQSGIGFFGNVYKYPNPTKSVITASFDNLGMRTQVAPTSVKEAAYLDRLLDKVVVAMCTDSTIGSIFSWLSVGLRFLGL